MKHSAIKSKRRIIVLCGRSTFESPIYRSWTDKITDHPLDYVQDYGPLWNPPDDTGLIVTHRHYHAPETTLIPRLVNSGIPVLILADGILEFRNTWQNPNITPTAMFQPVLGHKIAVIGKSQARVINSWGNHGKCEVVGLPRMDNLPLQKAHAPDQDKLRILVTTARTPGFTEEQRTTIIKSLTDLRNWFDKTSTIAGRAFEVTWRITGALAQTLEVPDTVTDITGRQMAEALSCSDILITTPSTAMLEGMRFGLPTALLDYTNSPAYVTAAWSITASPHLDTVIPELTTPPAEKLALQDMLLHDALECSPPATDRLIKLITSMLNIAEDCRNKNQPIVFPKNILTPSDCEPDLPAASPQGNLTPKQISLERDNLARLAQQQQQQILQLENKLQELSGASFRTLCKEAIRQKYQKLTTKSS